MTLLEGEFFVALGETFEHDQTVRLPESVFSIMAPGEPMSGYTRVDTVIQLHGTGSWGIEYIDDADEARS